MHRVSPFQTHSTARAGRSSQPHPTRAPRVRHVRTHPRRTQRQQRSTAQHGAGHACNMRATVATAATRGDRSRLLQLSSGDAMIEQGEAMSVAVLTQTTHCPVKPTRLPCCCAESERECAVWYGPVWECETEWSWCCPLLVRAGQVRLGQVGLGRVGSGRVRSSKAREAVLTTAAAHTALHTAHCTLHTAHYTAHSFIHPLPSWQTVRRPICSSRVAWFCTC